VSWVADWPLLGVKRTTAEYCPAGKAVVLGWTLRALGAAPEGGRVSQFCAPAEYVTLAV